MDYRERKYYLVRLNDGMSPFWWVKGHDNHGVRYDSYLKYFKGNIDSLKISPPYNHIKTNSDSGKWMEQYLKLDMCKCSSVVESVT